MPGFFVLAVLGLLQVRGEDDGGLVVGGADGEDIPEVGGDYVGGEEIQLVWRVDDVAGADGADVGVAALVEGAFDLDAAEEALVVGGYVVGSGFSPGFGDAESLLDGALHETEFGPLSATLGVRDVGAASWHRFSWVRQRLSARLIVMMARPGAEAPGFLVAARTVRHVNSCGSPTLRPDDSGPLDSRGRLSLHG
ncbi:MAG: hypothetical protein WBW57_05405, partial [Candidatus Sulfotelmatobacter sp.]